MFVTNDVDPEVVHLLINQSINHGFI